MPKDYCGIRSRPVVLVRHRCICLGLGTLALAAAAWLAWCVFHGWTSAELEQLVRAEAPPGCGRAEVEAFLDRHGIPHGYVEGMEPDGFNAGVARRAGFDDRGLIGVVQGEIGTGDANEHLLLPSEIFVYFFLDKQGRLAGHLVDSIIYGP